MAAENPRKRILVIDDDNLFLKTMNQLFSCLADEIYKDNGSKCYLYFAKNAHTALEYLDKQNNKRPLDLILSDFYMPGLSGGDLLKKMREDGYYTPFVVMSGKELDDEIKEILSNGAYSFLKKPFNYSELKSHVKNALAKKDSTIKVIDYDKDSLEIKVSSNEDARILYSFFNSLSKMKDNKKEKIYSAFEELLVNAQEWGNKFDPSKHVKIRYHRTDDFEEYTITDEGEGFDTEKIKHSSYFNQGVDPIHLQSIRREIGLRVGGMGIDLAFKTLLEEDPNLSLEYNEKGNEVRFRLHNR